MTSTDWRKAKDETVTFSAHRFLWSDRLAYPNKTKVSAVNTTGDAEGTEKGVANEVIGYQLSPANWS